MNEPVSAMPLSRLSIENIKALENTFADVALRQACLLGNIPEGFAIILHKIMEIYLNTFKR